MTRLEQEELDRRAEAAVALAGLGWPILPTHGVRPDLSCTCGNSRCDRRGKHPARKNYRSMATTDPALIRSYWRVVPFNMALMVPTDMVVLDVDDAGALDALASYRAWPITPTAVTTRGFHMYFRWTLDGDSPSIGGLDHVPLDVKGTNELITLPPSTSGTGHRYRWRDGESPFDVPLAPLPGPFAHHVMAIVRRRKARTMPVVDVTTIAGALELARRRARYAATTSNGAGRGASGLERALREAGADAPVIGAALDAFRAEVGR